MLLPNKFIQRPRSHAHRQWCYALQILLPAAAEKIHIKPNQIIWPAPSQRDVRLINQLILLPQAGEKRTRAVPDASSRRVIHEGR